MVRVPGDSYRGPLAALSEDETRLAAALRRHVEAVASREHNMFRPAALEAAARYLENTLSGLGFSVLEQRFPTSMGEVRNIEVEVPGSGREIVVVGAHYDSVAGSPGGNDNGSGVAATLELARRLRDATPAKTLRFVFFVNEEPPFFQGMDMGSRRYALRARERNERIAAMFCLETIGWYSEQPGSQRFPFPLGFFYPSTGNFLAFVSNLRSRALLHESIAAFRRGAGIPSEGVAAPALIPGVDWSDHASFWEQGYPALMLTDTAPYRYPHYHTAADTPDKVDYGRLARVVTGIEGMLRDLAGVTPSLSK
ncbi:MAG: M20/M25/M40 family metallo-hydrolase [Betaproteobacteria bacterium]|nr:M20/M25/M40 family metallo-hydrolase [Betaproteobacteria bacterium]